MKIIFKTDEENQNMINEGASTSKFMNAADKKLFGETSLAIQKSDKFS
jgi:hypothetical protein